MDLQLYWSLNHKFRSSGLWLISLSLDLQYVEERGPQRDVSRVRYQELTWIPVHVEERESVLSLNPSTFHSTHPDACGPNYTHPFPLICQSPRYHPAVGGSKVRRQAPLRRATARASLACGTEGARSAGGHRCADPRKPFRRRPPLLRPA